MAGFDEATEKASLDKLGSPRCLPNAVRCFSVKQSIMTMFALPLLRLQNTDQLTSRVASETVCRVEFDVKRRGQQMT